MHSKKFEFSNVPGKRAAEVIEAVGSKTQVPSCLEFFRGVVVRGRREMERR